LEGKLKKFIEDQLNDILKKIELRINSLQLNNIEGKISESDLKLINDLLRRVIELENLYRIISNQPKIDELEKEIKKIYELLQLKADKIELDKLSELYEELLRKLNLLQNSFDKFDFEKIDKLEYEINQIKLKIDYINRLIDSLKSSEGGEKIAPGKYVDLITFLEYKDKNDKTIEDIQEKLKDLYRLIDEILEALKNKVSYDDLKKLEGKKLNLMTNFIRIFTQKN